MYYVYVTDKIVKKCHSYANYTHVDVCVCLCVRMCMRLCVHLCVWVRACVCDHILFLQELSQDV